MSARATATSPAGAQGEPHTAHHAKVRLTPRAAVLFVSVFFVAVLSIAPIRTYLAQQTRLDELRRQAATMEAQNAALRERIADLRDPATLERLARECLGMVRPGEVAFVVIPRGEAPTPPDCG
ncbi:MAG TPA: septum formation initiator family protein [Actinomycetota bacterium]